MVLKRLCSSLYPRWCHCTAGAKMRNVDYGAGKLELISESVNVGSKVLFD